MSPVIPVQFCCSGHGESSGNAIISCIGNARISRLNLMLYRTLLSEFPLVAAAFAHFAIEEGHDYALKVIPATQTKYSPIHYIPPTD